MGKIDCFECGAEMEAVRGAYRYGGDLGVILRDVEIRRCPSCGEEEVVIPKIEELNRTIATDIAKNSGRFSPAEIRFLRTYLGHSSRDLANLMGVAAETVSRWESSRKPHPMGDTASRLLRVLVLSERPVEEYGLESLDTKAPPGDRKRLVQFTGKGSSREWKHHVAMP